MLVFRRDVCTRMPLRFTPFALLEALACACPMAFLSGVRSLTVGHYTFDASILLAVLTMNSATNHTLPSVH